jgi:hypothetical protein
MPRSAKIYIAITVLVGVFTLAGGLVSWKSDDPTRFFCYFLIACLASRFKVHLPGITGIMSANFFFVLICIATMSPSEGLAIACVTTVLHSAWGSEARPNGVRVLFNVASVSLAVSAASFWYSLTSGIHSGFGQALMLVLAACVYFVGNTLPLAVLARLAEAKALIKTWRECYFWSFPLLLGRSRQRRHARHRHAPRRLGERTAHLPHPFLDSSLVSPVSRAFGG